MYLPYYLVHSILLLSVHGVTGQEAPAGDLEQTCPPNLTLWDIGFSLQREWAQPHDNATCPIPLVEDTKDELEKPEMEKDDFVSFEEWKRIRQAPPARSTSNVAEPSASDIVQEAKGVAIPLPRSDNRYNYASPDCSARIIKSSSQTQHASSILHKSRDRYMLTPCKASEHWVIVELCDEIRIESFEIAVWEFFSGIVRDIKISTEDDDGWKEVGSFVGRNVRGVQSFYLNEPTSFYRFIRLDFPSYYGSEYYCPVSQLKVFGMNQLEAFKWEQKHTPVKPVVVTDDEQRIVEEQERAQMNRQRRKGEAEREKELGELERLVRREANREQVVPQVNATITKPTLSTSSTAKPGGTVNDTASQAGNSTAESSIKRDQSESIYATINRRLNNLEGNSSLVARYIEEQSRVMRSALAALERDWDEWRMERDTAARATWDQERMRQEDRLGRIISMIESQRMVWDNDRQAINAQLRLLSEELSYERRRGWAQMAMLVVIIGLGIATRPSVIDAVLKPLMQPNTHFGSRLDPRSRHKGTPRRPSTPIRRTGQFRSFSIMDPRNTMPGRKLAKSAHLHTLKAKDLEVTDVEDHLG